MATHPGTITYMDGDTNTVISVKPIDTVPESMRFAGAIPVVKVVTRTMNANTREVVEYGPNDELLRSTIQTR